MLRLLIGSLWLISTKADDGRGIWRIEDGIETLTKVGNLDFRSRARKNKGSSTEKGQSPPIQRQSRGRHRLDLESQRVSSIQEQVNSTCTTADESAHIALDSWNITPTADGLPWVASRTKSAPEETTIMALFTADRAKLYPQFETYRLHSLSPEDDVSGYALPGSGATQSRLEYAQHSLSFKETRARIAWDHMSVDEYGRGVYVDKEWKVWGFVLDVSHRVGTLSAHGRGS